MKNTAPLATLLALAFIIGATVTARPADGDSAADPAPVPPPAPERIEIGLSTDTIQITSDFDGTTLAILGAVDNADPLVRRQGRYDIFVILEGPRTDMVVRRKGRVFGIWMNVSSQTYDNTPSSYLIASTRLPRDVASLDTIARLSLGVGQIRVSPDRERPPAPDVEAFTSALRQLKERQGLYRQFPAGVQFISASLFRAELYLPAHVPLGDHRARAFLFRNGELVARTEAPLRIAKAGFEFTISDFAHTRSLQYGLSSVFLALFVGWLGRIVFRKD